MAKQKARASTQEHLDIEDIVDDLVIMKNGWVALVMSTTAVNFDLLSEAEQDATIYAYAAFLNSLTFPLQTLVRSKKADITSYFNSLEEAYTAQPNPDLKRQIQKYQDFIESTVQQKTVLDKKFYLIINFSPLEFGFKGIIGKKPTATGKSKSQLIAEAITALSPKRDHIIKQTSRLGLITKQLTTQELIELFYDIYNPAPIGTQRVLLDNASYTTPIVKPALEVPTPAPSPTGAGPVPTGPEDVRAGGPSQPQPSAATNPQADQLPTTNYPPADLRPVPPASPRGEPPSPPPTTQSDALRGLQEATARAAQIVNRSPGNQVIRQSGINANPSPTPDKPITRQPDNLKI